MLQLSFANRDEHRSQLSRRCTVVLLVSFDGMKNVSFVPCITILATYLDSENLSATHS